MATNDSCDDDDLHQPVEVQAFVDVLAQRFAEGAVRVADRRCGWLFGAVDDRGERRAVLVGGTALSGGRRRRDAVR